MQYWLHWLLDAVLVALVAGCSTGCTGCWMQYWLLWLLGAATEVPLWEQGYKMISMSHKALQLICYS